MNTSNVYKKLEEADPEEFGAESVGQKEEIGKNNSLERVFEPSVDEYSHIIEAFGLEDEDGYRGPEEIEPCTVFEILGNERRLNTVWTTYLADHLSEDVDKGHASEVSAYLERENVQKTSSEDLERITDYIRGPSQRNKLVDRDERKRVMTSYTQFSREKLLETGAIEVNDKGFLKPGRNSEEFLSALEGADLDVWNENDGLLQRLSVKIPEKVSKFSGIR